MDTGHPAVDQDGRRQAVGAQDGHTLVGHREVGRPRRYHHHPPGPRRSRPPAPPRPAIPSSSPRPSDGRSHGRRHLGRLGPGQQHRSAPGLRQQLSHDEAALLGRLPRHVDGLAHPLPQPPGGGRPGRSRDRRRGDGAAGRRHRRGVTTPPRTSSRSCRRAGSSMVATILPGHGHGCDLSQRPECQRARHDRLSGPGRYVHRRSPASPSPTTPLARSFPWGASPRFSTPSTTDRPIWPSSPSRTPSKAP